MKNSPIFVHSLFRAGSTYLFNVFRRSEAGYWCYQEPENEFVIHVNENPERLLDLWENAMLELRHPKLDRPYFWEIYEVRDSIRGLFKKSFSYDDYFVQVPPGLPEDQRKYFGALIANAKGRPVLGGCRTTGRVAALKDAFGGIHIHLWREPRNQWWSYKVNHYFDATVQLIFNASSLPAVLKEAKQEVGLTDFHDEDVQREFEYAFKHPLPSINNYSAFFALWLFSYLECEKYADVSINIDMLSIDQKYRAKAITELMNYGINGLDFSDCSIPHMAFTEQDVYFFKDVEEHVFHLFLRHGYEEAGLRRTRDVLERVIRSIKLTQKDMTRDLLRSHEMVRRYMDRVAVSAAALGREQAQNQWLQREWDAAKAKVDELNHSSHHWWTVADRLNRDLQAVYASRSWRFTRPMRALGWLLRRGGNGIRAVPGLTVLAVKAMGKPLVASAIRFAMARPSLKKPAVAWVRKFPKLKTRLRHFAQARGIVGDASIVRATVASSGPMQSEVLNELLILPPQARHIYEEIKAAIAQRQEND